MQILFDRVNNPVHHGFVSHPLAYGWSSYMTCKADKETKLLRDQVIKLFGDRDNFE